MAETPTEKSSTEETQVENKPETSNNKEGNSTSRTPLYISIIALLLAAYAASAASVDNSTNIEKRLASLDNQVANIDNQLVNLNKDVQSNRDSLIQTKLQKAILNLQEIGNIAGEETKATISGIEQMLYGLTSAGKAAEEESAALKTEETPAVESVDTTAEPATEQPAETTPAEVAPEVAPIEEPTTETTPEAPLTDMFKETTPEEPQAF